MATYKVLQDIEAEDTLIGPLTLRQCLYAAMAVVGIYLSVVFVTKHVPFLIIFTLPIIAFGVFFAFPWTKQQTTEVWALAKVRFMLKPRKRIWNQSGVKELVTITVPKNLKRAYASALTPTEVESRLKALADTIDSRGWAVKNVDLGYFTKPTVLGGASDRLLSQASLPQEVPTNDDSGAADIFDVANNPVAQKFDAMMSQSADAHRQQLMQQMSQPAAQQAPEALQPGPAATPESNYWHMRTIPVPAPEVAFSSPQPTPVPQAPAIPVMPALSLPAPTSQAPTIQPPAGYAQPMYAAPTPAPTDVQMRAPAMQPVTAAPVLVAPVAPQPAVTAQPNPAILELANNNDLDIATIAREAQARNPEPPDEVIVSLH